MQTSSTLRGQHGTPSSLRVNLTCFWECTRRTWSSFSHLNPHQCLVRVVNINPFWFSFSFGICSLILQFFALTISTQTNECLMHPFSPQRKLLIMVSLDLNSVPHVYLFPAAPQGGTVVAATHQLNIVISLLYFNAFFFNQGRVKGAAGEEEEGLSSPGWLWGQDERCMFASFVLSFSTTIIYNHSILGQIKVPTWTQYLFYQIRWSPAHRFTAVFQKWRKELAKNREKLIGSEKEKDKKMIEKEKEEKRERDKKEVWNTLNGLYNCLSPTQHCQLLFFFCFLFSEKKEGEEEVQQGEKRPPAF